MSYLSVIPLADAKDYLGIDGTAYDTKLTRFINAAFIHLETVTNVHAIDKDKVYYYDNGCVNVYDYPINSTTNTTHEVEVKTLHSVYTESDSDIETITLNIGYTDPAQVPADYIECAYSLIEWLFEGNELSALPDVIKLMIGALKRFTI